MRQFYRTRIATDLQSRAWLLEEPVANGLVSQRPDSVDELCKRLGNRSSTRITVILPSGKVVGDSDELASRMDSHADRPEVRDALAGGICPAVRYSSTLKQEMMYVAIPVRQDGKMIGVLRTSIPVTAIDQALRAIQLRIALVSLLVVLLAAGVSLVVSRRISRPLEQLKRGAERLAQGAVLSSANLAVCSRCANNSCRFLVLPFLGVRWPSKTVETRGNRRPWKAIVQKNADVRT